MMNTSLRTRDRATAIIIKGDEILLIKRVKLGREYFILPGGGVEAGETVEQAFIRETKEELGLDVLSYELLFTIENMVIPPIATIHDSLSQTYHCFLVREYQGIPEIGGEEKASMSIDNQYHITWVSLSKLQDLGEIYPKEVAIRLSEEYTKGALVR